MSKQNFGGAHHTNRRRDLEHTIRRLSLVGLNDRRRPEYSLDDIILASWYGNVRVVEFLLKKAKDDGVLVDDLMDDDGQTPLFHASQGGKPYVVEMLLVHGADVNAANHDGETPLHAAVELLLVADDADKDDTTYRAYIEAVRKLLENHANVNAVNNDGQTPLHTAAYHGHAEVVELLLANNVIQTDNADNADETPLFLASQEGNTEVVRKLLENHANVNAVNNDGQTPLHTAAYHGHAEVVKLLLANNDVLTDQPDAKGRTPLLLATQKGNENVMKLFSKDS